MLRDVDHLLDCIGLEQVIVVEMVKQDVNPLVHVFHLRLEGLRSNSRDAGNLRR
jgi:hypothetical protein